LYQWGGLPFSLMGSALMLASCWAITIALPLKREADQITGVPTVASNETV